LPDKKAIDNKSDKPVGSFQPVLLLPNVSYPTYQLHAVAGRDSQDVDAVLKICVLETADWLRRRFREIDVPEALRLPPPNEYDAFSFDRLSSSFSDVGYELEIIWLAEEKIWALRLEEPDHGSNPGSEKQLRNPVPGRIIETNISYRATDQGVECGFKTVVSEPKGTDAECEVYRYTCIKNIARNPHAGLWQGQWKLSDDAHFLRYRGDVVNLAKWLQDESRMVPAVIISEYEEATTEKNERDMRNILSVADPYANPPQNLFDGIFHPVIPEGLDDSVFIRRGHDEKSPKEIPEIAALPRYRMGFAHYFTLPEQMREHFAAKAEMPIDPGEIVIVDPPAFGGAVRRYSYVQPKSDAKRIADEINSAIGNFPKNKKVNFGECVFAADARDREREKAIRLHQSKEELFDDYENKLQDVVKNHKRESATLHSTIAQKSKEIEKLNELYKDLQDKNAELVQSSREREEKLLKKIASKDELIFWYQSRGERPTTFTGIIEWAGRKFADKLILHKKSHDGLRGADSSKSKVDLAQACDALEYLATEYRSELLGELSEDERNSLCSQKYGRLFDVTPVKGLSAKSLPDYRIKYYAGARGKPVESTLDLHLRVGNDSENLLRIYFLYDKEKKLIVVGSMPDHLPTHSYQ
jgi:flagellar motility protein MotE (MotC chaperone)